MNTIETTNQTTTKIREIVQAPDIGEKKILLVKPHWEWGTRFEASPPLGLMYISSAIKKRFPGVHVKLTDLRLEKDRTGCFRDCIKTWQPDIVGFTCITGDFDVLRKLSKIAKDINPFIHICCGGPYPTHCPEDFVTLTGIDSIIRGEGEESFCKLLEYLYRNTCPSSDRVPEGISIRMPDGSLKLPSISPRINKPDLLSFPDWDLIDMDRYSNVIQTNAILAGKRYMPVFTSRGCPFHCSYCHNTFGKKTRMRSPENIINEISELVNRYDIDEIQIYDDIFNIDRKRLIRICDLIVEKGLKIKLSFPNAVRGDMLDNKMIDKLKAAGAYMITFAIETASPELQHRIHKYLDIDKTVRAIRYADRIGLITRGFFMIGFPTETEDEIKRTIRFPAKLPLSTISVFKAIPFKGTPLYEFAKKHTNAFGLKRLEKPDSTYFAGSTFYTESTGINLNKYILICYFTFFTPWRLIRYFRKIPRKILYLKLLGALLKTGFGSCLKQRSLTDQT